MCLLYISECTSPSVCEKLYFKRMDIFSLNGEVHFLSWLYTSSVLKYTKYWFKCFIPFVSLVYVHSIRGSIITVIIAVLIRTFIATSLPCVCVCVYVCVYVCVICAYMCGYVCVYMYISLLYLLSINLFTLLLLWWWFY